jgi:hypothetical protein
MLERVVSGGQTGADQAGWRAAKAVGLETGGWMPRGFLTEDGHRPEFRDLYGAVEHPSSDYPPCRLDNLTLTAELGGPGWGLAVAFDATPRGKLSPGTRGLLNDRDGPLAGRPCPRIVVVKLARLVGGGRSGFRPSDRDHTPEWLAGLVERCRAEALLVAGNRESTAPGIGDWVEAFLVEVFRQAGRE